MSRLVLVLGGLLVASAAGMFGAVRRRPLMSALAAGLMFVESELMFTLSPVTIGAGALFLLSAVEGRRCLD